MSMKALEWAMYYVPAEMVKGALLRILLLLADHADTQGKGAFPSQKRIVALTGYSRRTIQNGLHDLETAGLIRRGDQRITEHDDEHWSLECRENLDSIRMVLKDRPLRILDVLAARWESNIGWNYWRSRHGVDDMCCWYDVLERIGYRVSEDERKALKGAYLDGGDDES